MQIEMTESNKDTLRTYETIKWIIVLLIIVSLILIMNGSWLFLTFDALGVLYMIRLKNKYKRRLIDE